MKTTILWLRRDLRLYDNAALNWACDNSSHVIPVYIHAAAEEQPWAPGGASRWWLHHSLLALDKKLQAYGLNLNFFSGDSNKVLSEIIAKTGADTLVFNKLYEPHLHRRDEALQQTLKHVEIITFDSGLFFTPGTVLNNQQLPYRVFTPFYKKIRPLLDQLYHSYSVPSPVEGLKKLAPVTVDFALSLHALDLLDDHRWHEKLHEHWLPGEENALNLLEHFLDESVRDYQADRDIPSHEGTSRLSPYLHFGEITPQQIYISLWPLLEGAYRSGAMQSAEVFLKQLLWREFAHHVLWFFPHTSSQPMNPRYKKTFWRAHKNNFNLWTRGQTGIPIVDAGMKQLWQTGWMHNRVRLISSSFLTKNLGINWTEGAHWFWDTLVDADLANNSMGWQWVAGCGVDAAPYYRVFNPNTQTTRFDGAHKYINTWVPEHIELDYPAPIVDLASSREKALQRYKQNITSQGDFI